MTAVIDTLVNDDISQIKKPFPEVGDFHSSNAIAFFGRDKAYSVYKEDKIKFKEEIRGVAKIKGLALCYGLSYKGLMDVTNNDEAKARELYDNFFNNLPNVKANMEKLIKNTSKDLYLTNLFGRRLYVKGWANKDDWKAKASARNNTLNFGIQSLGADSAKLDLYKVSAYIENNRMDKNSGNLITEHFIARIVSVDQTHLESVDLEADLDSCNEGHTLVLVVDSENNVVSEYDRLLQLPVSLIDKYSMTIVH